MARILERSGRDASGTGGGTFSGGFTASGLLELLWADTVDSSGVSKFFHIAVSPVRRSVSAETGGGGGFLIGNLARASYAALCGFVVSSVNGSCTAAREEAASLSLDDDLEGRLGRGG